MSEDGYIIDRPITDDDLDAEDPIRYDDGTTLADRPLVDRDVPLLPPPDLD